MAQRQQSFIMVGHSHIRNFGTFMSGTFQGRNMFNLNLSLDQVRIACHGEGGMRLAHLDRNDSASQYFLELFRNASGCIIHIGDNDVSNYAPEYLAQEIIAKAIAIAQAYGIENMFVAPLLPRRSGARGDVVTYNKKALEVNRILSESAPGQLSILKSLFAFPDENLARYIDQEVYFRRDGVHLNDFGNRRCFNYFRGVVIRAIR